MSLDYFNIGASVDIIEYSELHTTLFFTSTMNNSGANYTHINTVQIFKFIEEGVAVYKT